jgi:dolichol-phosphate mannosyltransferase
VVIPAYEEIDNLKNLLPKINYQISLIDGLNYEILVVLPSFTSKDEMETIRNLSAIPVIRKPTNNFGDALRSGFSALDVRSTLAITMDADGSHRPERINDLYLIAENCDIGVASRYVKGGSTDNSAVLRFMSRILNLIYKIVLNVDCNDISTNFKIYKSRDIRKIELECKNFDIVEEIIYKIHLLHNKDTKITEIPDHFHNRDLGVTKRKLGPFIITYILTLIRLRFRAK